MKRLLWFILFCIASLGVYLFLCPDVVAPYVPFVADMTCEEWVAGLSRTHAIDKPNELAQTIRLLQSKGHLPDYYVSKKHAQSLGWHSGMSLWRIAQLRGKQLGGDRYANIDRILPKSYWREADFDYDGQRDRSAKRIVYDNQNQYLTFDHYRTFEKVKPCR